MFNNIGGKIKTLAGVTCVLGMIASACGAAALWAQNSRYTPTIFLGVLVLGLGCLGSWVGSFFTYGFGELIENTKAIHEDNLKIQGLLNNQKVEVLKPCDAPQEKIEKPEQAAPATTTQTVEPVMGMIKCPVCGKIQEADRKVCWNCGAKFTIK